MGNPILYSYAADWFPVGLLYWMVLDSTVKNKSFAPDCPPVSAYALNHTLASTFYIHMAECW